MRALFPAHGRDHRIGGEQPIPPGKWHYIGATDEPVFENSWDNVGGGQRELRFRLTNEDQTEIEGVVSGGASGTVVTTLPERYRPNQDTPAPGVGGDWLLNTDGELIFTTGCCISPTGDTIDAVIAGLDPAGWWKLNESSGHIAADSSGNGLDLSSAVTGGQDPDWGAPAGPPGEQAADFQTGTGGIGGTAGREARSWAAALTGDFTAGIFISRNNTDASPIMGQGNPARSSGGGWQLGLNGTSGFPYGYPYMQIKGSGLGTAAADSTLAVSTWVFLAIVHTGTTWKLYVNGLLQTTTLTGGTYTPAPSPYNLWIGQDGASGGTAVDVPNFVGSYAFLVPSALTGAQLLEVYNSAVLPGAGAAGKALLATGLGGTTWDFPLEVTF